MRDNYRRLCYVVILIRYLLPVVRYFGWINAWIRDSHIERELIAIRASSSYDCHSDGFAPRTDVDSDHRWILMSWYCELKCLRIPTYGTCCLWVGHRVRDRAVIWIHCEWLHSLCHWWCQEIVLKVVDKSLRSSHDHTWVAIISFESERAARFLAWWDCGRGYGHKMQARRERRRVCWHNFKSAICRRESGENGVCAEGG